MPNEAKKIIAKEVLTVFAVVFTTFLVSLLLVLYNGIIILTTESNVKSVNEDIVVNVDSIQILEKAYLEKEQRQNAITDELIKTAYQKRFKEEYQTRGYEIYQHMGGYNAYVENMLREGRMKYGESAGWKKLINSTRVNNFERIFNGDWVANGMRKLLLESYGINTIKELKQFINSHAKTQEDLLNYERAQYLKHMIEEKRNKIQALQQKKNRNFFYNNEILNICVKAFIILIITVYAIKLLLWAIKILKT